MEIIDDLEPVKRGPYAGVVGYLDFSGNIDTAIAIRTLVVTDDGHASVEAGAGIVADSVPEHEDLECHNKAPRPARRCSRSPPHDRQPPSTGRLGRSALMDLRTEPRRGAGAVGGGAGQRTRRPRVPAGPAEPGHRQPRPRRDDLVAAAGADGKMVAWLRVTRTADDEILLDAPTASAEPIVARLERFKLRTKADIDALDWVGGSAARPWV